MDGMEFDDEIIAEFVTESGEHLASIEEDFLALEKQGQEADPELVNKVFRAAHTIKGTAGFLGFNKINELAHAMETILVMMRNAQLTPSATIVDALLAGADSLKTMLSDVKNSNGTDIAALVARLGDVLNPEISGAIKREMETNVALVGEGGEESFFVIDEFSARSLPQSDAYLYALTFELATLTQSSQHFGIGLMKQLFEKGEILDGKLVTPMDDIHAEIPEGPLNYLILYSTRLDPGEIRQIEGLISHQRLMIRPEDEGVDSPGFTDNGTITLLDDDGTPQCEMEYKRIGEILVERGEMSWEDVDKVLSMQELKFGEVAVQAGLVSEDTLKEALAMQVIGKTDKPEILKQEQLEVASTIRVPAAKVDALVNLVGELVTFQARLNQVCLQKDDPELKTLAKGGERLIWALRDNAMSVRMLPIGVTFSKFNRLVRDLGKEMGKEIELTTEGSETELDKTVIERLNDPLVHLIRNSVDHGIESPAVRRSAGKPEKGTIHLAAEHAGANVLIHITDDGAGLDVDAIRAKALERGLMSANTELSDKEIFAMIFEPGFSTAKKVTSVSGRGVGMDVVKKNVEALRGAIEIESVKGKGTVITLKLPLTLAIIDGLLVRIAEAYYVIPLSVVERCVELSRADVKNAHGRHVITVGGSLVPYIHLRETFQIDGVRPEIEQIVIAGVDDRTVGFVVDHVIGEYQTVIKPLGRIYKDVDKVSGATIMGDGTVALILDVGRLVQEAQKEEHMYSGSSV